MSTSEPVVVHHGREGGDPGGNEARPTASTACWAALFALRRGVSAEMLVYGRLSVNHRARFVRNLLTTSNTSRGSATWDQGTADPSKYVRTNRRRSKS